MTSSSPSKDTKVQKYKAIASKCAFFCFLLASMILSAGGHIVVGDEETMFRLTQNVVAGQELSVESEPLVIAPQPHPVFSPDKTEVLLTTSSVPGRDDKTYSKYGIGQSLVVIPLYIVGQLLAKPLSLPEADLARFAVSLLNPIALVGCGCLMKQYLLALGCQRSTARWVAIASLFTSMAWPYVKTFYPQPSVTFLILAGTYAAYRWRQTSKQKWLWCLALVCAFLVLFRINTVIIVPIVTLYLWILSPPEKRWKSVIIPGIGLLCGLGLTGLYNWLRFGSVFSSGYHEVAWTTPVILGLYGLLFSPGKGLFLYNPLLILSLGGWIIFLSRYRAEALLSLGLAVTYIFFYAPYNYWTGGFNWGPRFLLPIVLPSFLPLGLLLEHQKSRLVKLLFVLLFVIGLTIQLPAILVDHSRFLYQELATGEVDAYSKTIYETEHSPIFKQWPTAISLLKAYTSRETWQAAQASLQKMIAPGIRNGRALSQAEFLRRNALDLWWLNNHLVNADWPTPPALVAPWIAVGLISVLVLFTSRNSTEKPIPS